MDEREELAALRRLAELEAKASGQTATKPQDLKQVASKSDINGLPRTFLGFDMSPDPAALARLNAATDKMKKQSPEAFKEQKRSDLANYAEGFKQAYSDIPQSVVGLALEGTDALGLTDNIAPIVKKSFREDEQGKGKFFDVGRGIGDFLETLPVGSLSVAKGATLLPTVVNGIAQGATSAALTSQQSDTPAWQQTAMGGGLGGAFSAAGYGVGKMLTAAPPPDAKLLMDEGVPLTVGQRLGGTAKRVEDRMRSIPVVGGGIRNAQQRSVDGLNRAVANRALSPIGRSLPDNVPVGRQAAEFVQKELGQAYDDVLSQMSAQADQVLVSDIAAVQQAAIDSGLPESQMNRLTNTIKQNIAGRFAANGNSLTGDAIKSVDSELRRQAKGLIGDASWDNQELGHRIEDLRTAFKDALARQNPSKATELRRVDRGWANYAVMRAAQKSSTKDAAFLPGQLSIAVRQADKSAGKGRYAAGKALMQELSDAAQSRLPNSIPDSGTTERLLSALAIGGGGLMMPKALIPLAAARAAYSRPVQAGAVKMLSGGPTAAATGRAIQRLPLGFAGGALVPLITSK